LTSVTAACEHGVASHDGTESSVASAPEASRAWLLIEHPGPWPPEPAEVILPEPARGTVSAAVALGIRVQLIRRPGRHETTRSIFAGWTAGSQPWLRRGEHADDSGWLSEPELEGLSAGRAPAFGWPVSEPLFLVCAHGRRNACCARFGGPLARALAAQHPGQVWETTHVGGHRFAANLVILPHGLYYGPVGAETAAAAISAYERGRIVPECYRGRAGQPKAVQAAEHALLVRSGSLAVEVGARP
jgi:Sucrase/ferredoxin-like